ncbi:hypothetical protein [Microbacterium sp. 10M-3C3]|uniref:hypothetical protein n=1 Tax=Microbacterium sp. 10M-3C3 TaxID=2483401 RepID=UPI000F64004E|nr:hypothetical protein [Microbacterium sp. 10M-3C3]
MHDARPHRVVPLVVGAAPLLVFGLALVALAPSAATVFVSAAAIGLGVGVLTPLGFARLAATVALAAMAIATAVVAGLGVTLAARSGAAPSEPIER